MAKNSHSREDGQRRFKKYVEEIRNRTNHGVVLSNEVFKEFENEKWISLAETEKFHLSKIHSVGIFVLAGLIKKLSKINRTYYIEWCGGNGPIDDIAKIYKKALNAHQKKDNNVTKKVKQFKNKQIQKPMITNHMMSREEYKLVCEQPKEEDIENVHKINLEVYIQRRNDPQPESKFFEILKENETGALEIIDVRKTTNKEGKVINRQIVNCHYKQLGIISIKDDKLCYWTKGMIPTKEMAKDICYEEIYKKYFYYQTKKAKINATSLEAKKAEEKRLADEAILAEENRKAEEKRLADEADLAAVTTEIETERLVEIEKSKVVETIESTLPHQKEYVITDDINLADFEKTSDSEKLVIIFQRIQAIEEYQEKQSKNLLTVAEILAKTTI